MKKMFINKKTSFISTIKIPFLIVAMLFVFQILGNTSQAAMWEMSFEGTIGWIQEVNDTYTGEYKVGDKVKLNFFIDTEAQGYSLRYDGNKNIRVDNQNTDYFYTQFLGGDIIEKKYGNLHIDGHHSQEIHLGWRSKSPTGNNYDLMLLGGGNNTDVAVYGPNTDIENWRVGQKVFMSSLNYLNGGDLVAWRTSPRYTYNPTATLISKTLVANYPVPVPSSLLIFGSGLIGVFGVIKKKWRKEV
jgi:hypothetical protein